MTPIAAKIVFLASSTLGVASLGSTAYLVAHPRAFATPTAVAPEPRYAAIPARPAPPEPASPREIVVELPAVVVTGSHKPLIPKARATHHATASPKTLAPCSEWRDMGPTAVRKGETEGSHRVRTLCP